MLCFGYLQSNQVEHVRRVIPSTKSQPVREPVILGLVHAQHSLFGRREHLPRNLHLRMSGIGVMLAVPARHSLLIVSSHPSPANKRVILRVKASYRPAIVRLLCAFPDNLAGMFKDLQYMRQIAAVTGIIITWLYLRATLCE